MFNLFGLVPQAHSSVWAGVLAVIAYYALLSVFLHLRFSHTPIMTQYKPPGGISPAVAACLLEDGRSERAFAAALVSLAVKRTIRIQQASDRYVLQKLRDASDELSPEESAILSEIFSGFETYAFNATDSDLLCDAYRKFEEILDGITRPQLLSTHPFLWAFGVVGALGICMRTFLTQPGLGSQLALWSVVYIGVWVALGASCLISAVRVWPDTIGKISSHLGFGSSPKRPITLNDTSPFSLTVLAAAGFLFLGASTSSQFALLVAALVLIVTVARGALEAPTARGRDVINRLNGFRNFMLRTDADRMTRENSAGIDPKTLEAYTAYAVAFGVDRGWGRDFAFGVSELIEYERGTEPWANFGIGRPGRLRISWRAKK